MRRTRTLLVLAALAVIALPGLAIGQSAAVKLKADPAAPDPAADTSTDLGAGALRGPALPDQTPSPRADILAGPRAPAPPQGPRAPAAPPAPSSGLRTPASSALECRRTCATARFQCLSTGDGACDSDWSRCVITCNLPKTAKP